MFLLLPDFTGTIFFGVGEFRDFLSIPIGFFRFPGVPSGNLTASQIFPEFSMGDLFSPHFSVEKIENLLILTYTCKSR